MDAGMAATPGKATAGLAKVRLKVASLAVTVGPAMAISEPGVAGGGGCWRGGGGVPSAVKPRVVVTVRVMPRSLVALTAVSWRSAPWRVMRYSSDPMVWRMR